MCRFIKLGVSQAQLLLLLCVVYCYLCSTNVFYVFILSLLASTKSWSSFIFMEILSYAYVVIVFMGFLTHSWIIIPLFQNHSSSVSEPCGITFVNLMLMTFSISDIALQKFSIRYIACSCSCIKMVNLRFCFNVSVHKYIVSFFM